MDEKQMTICQCCEYLDTMVGDNPEVKDCIDYIQERAEAMSRKLMEYKEKQVPINSAEFKHFKLHSDSTLKRLTKDDLIDYIKMLYHNWKVSDERAENIKAYAEILQEKQTPKKPGMMRFKKYDGYNIGFCQCGAVLDTSMIDDVNYCHKCGHRIDWGENE